MKYIEGGVAIVSDIISFNEVENKLLLIRNQAVLLDSSVAELYGVEVKRVNEAVANNAEKFPEGYVFSLTKEEWGNLKSKISTSSWGGKNKLKIKHMIKRDRRKKE